MTTKVNKQDDPMGVWPTVEPNVPTPEVCKDCGGNCDAVMEGLANSLNLKLNKMPGTNVKLRRGKPFVPEALNTVMYVRNDAEGLAFLKRLNQSLNHANYRLRLRGRNTNRIQFVSEGKRWKGSVWQSLRRSEASYFAVYIDKLRGAKSADAQNWHALADLRQENYRLKRKLADITSDLCVLSAKASEDHGNC